MTAEDPTCKDCEGSGERSCEACNGTGHGPCPTCEGATWVHDPSDGGTMCCPGCDDSGVDPDAEDCTECDGTGKEDCTGCTGYGTRAEA